MQPQPVQHAGPVAHLPPPPSPPSAMPSFVQLFEAVAELAELAESEQVQKEPLTPLRVAVKPQATPQPMPEAELKPKPQATPQATPQAKPQPQAEPEMPQRTIERERLARMPKGSLVSLFLFGGMPESRNPLSPMAQRRADAWLKRLLHSPRTW
ncbi:hypothetical protein T492DRAFT_1080192 [Pavlovales sp. CCMP2436]|nr:hypothetical protein T492DRAFT_1080192 [Pavlovales sp. CCMP2436]